MRALLDGVLVFDRSFDQWSTPEDYLGVRPVSWVWTCAAQPHGVGPA